MLLALVSSHNDDSFEMRPPLSDENGPPYRQQDKIGESLCGWQLLASILCEDSFKGCCLLNYFQQCPTPPTRSIESHKEGAPTGFHQPAGNIWEWRVTVAHSSTIEVASMTRLLDFGWPDMAAPLVRTVWACALLYLQCSLYACAPTTISRGTTFNGKLEAHQESARFSSPELPIC